MKTIGFAGTFYTLWDVEVERVNVSLGAWYDKVICTYYKNLSKNLNEAIAKAGTDNVDESLKGKRRSFEYKKPLVVEPSIMTELESLYWILLRNDPAHLVEGVRQSAFDRALELGYIKEIVGNYEHSYWTKAGCDGRNQGIMKEIVVKRNVAYEWKAKLRYNDTWFHSCINKFFIGGI